MYSYTEINWIKYRGELALVSIVRVAYERAERNPINSAINIILFSEKLKFDN